MISREELKKLFRELSIRFDTDPKRYSKFDFGVLLRYIKGESTSLDDLISEFNTAQLTISDAQTLISLVLNNIASHTQLILSLGVTDTLLLQSLQNLSDLLTSLGSNVSGNATEITNIKYNVQTLNTTLNNTTGRVTSLESVIYPIDNNFLDKRLKVNSLNELKDWDFITYPIPEGFEVCVNGAWYTYESDRENDTTGHFFKRSSGTGSGDGFGAGVPVLDLEIINNLSRDAIPNKYIFIPTEGDLTPRKDGEDLIEGEENGLLQILFAAIKSLQALITKLQNSFSYGISSYKDKNTAFSREASSNSSEPLWSIDENNLEELEEIAPDLSSGTDQFSPKNKVESLGNNTLKFGDYTVTWYLDFSLYDLSKLFIYLTLEKTDLGNGRLVIVNTQSLDNTSNTVNVDLENLDLVTCQKYNILLIISRKLEVTIGKEKVLKGYNYIWLSVKDYTDDVVLVEGYYNNGVISDTPIYLDDRYTISQLLFKNLILSKFKLYGKDLDFSALVIPSEPLVSNYKNEAAHITIRSAANTDVIDDIKHLLLTDELVWSRREKKLYIIQDGEKIAIGSASSGEQSTDNMSQSEVIELLYNAGVIKAQKDTAGVWHYIGPTPFSGFTLINEDTNKSFDVTIDAYGNIKTLCLNSDDTISAKYSVAKLTPMSEKDADGTTLNYHVRGAIGQMALGNPGTGISFDKDQKLYADRIKIGAFYAPYKSDVDSKICGCSHAYIELENTSDQDFNLDNCYLFWVDTNTAGSTAVNAEKLALKGTLKAGSTYLIRGKQYAKPSDANCFINVSTFDQEWYDSNGKLIDLLIQHDTPYGIALLYGKSSLDSNYHLVKTRTSADEETHGSVTIGYDAKGSFIYGYTTNYIDSVYYSNLTTPANRIYKADNAYCWASAGIYVEHNSIYKNTFELDPAKQAFLGLTTVDSSRARNTKLDNLDAMIVRLWDKYISFPHSDYEIPVSVFTPKASFENKNVSTDKTKLEVSKPNMVTCSFGIDMYTTRTFNWISCGYFDEYVWLKLGNTWVPFESYKDGDGYESTAPTYTSYPYRKEFKKTNVNTIYKRLTGTFPGDGTFFTSHKCILRLCSEAVTTPTTYTYKVGRKKANGTIDESYCSDEYTFTLYPNDYQIKVYQTTDQQGFHWVEYQVWNAVAKTLNALIISDLTPNNGSIDTLTITRTNKLVLDSFYYNEIPTDIVSDTSVSKIYNDYIEITELSAFENNIIYYELNISYNEVSEDEEFNSNEEYYILQEDLSYVKCVDLTSFEDDTTYYKLEIAYNLTSDAIPVSNKKYYTRTFVRSYLQNCNRSTKIIPVLINTGDMTLNGTRINEWLDYYNAGIDLFKHLELVNVVGNNDLCGPDPEVLGTGDDSGKSNSYYFHLFYCYEINESYIAPIINGKYIPSLYYIDSTYCRLVCINSEITNTTCEKLYGIKSTAGNIINAYTGYEITSSPKYVAETVGFTPIYQMIKEMFDDTITLGSATKQLLPICHEMPYTVITTDSLKSTAAGNYQNRVSRSLSNAGKLVGSHLNQIDPSDEASLYWMSRLMDWFNYTYGNCKLMLGGHKHTFTATYPVREYYLYTVYTQVNQSNTSFDTDTLYFIYNELKNKFESTVITKFDSGTVYYTSSHKNSKDDGPMVMPTSLKYDTADFKGGTVDHLSKFPLTKRGTDTLTAPDGVFYPYTCVPNLTGGVVYFMCQASSYKLTSNKELPSTSQKFSQILPGLSGTKSANTQKFPMYAVIDLKSDNTFDIQLCAVSGIMNPSMDTVLAKGTVPESPVFNQQNAVNGNIKVYTYNMSNDWIRKSTTTEEKANDHTDCWQPYEDDKTFITLSVS